MGSESRPVTADPAEAGAHRPWMLLSPTLLALVLALPCLGFSFLSDDYPFLQRGAAFGAGQLVPSAESVFYRPISRELYFALLAKAGNRPLVGHVANAVLLAATVLLLTVLARRVGGTRFALVTGFLFGALGSLPLLVGWISCSQDLLAMAFLLGALNLALRGKHLLAAGLSLAALWSKETAVFFMPGLVFCALQSQPERRSPVRLVSSYAVAFGAWLALHPTLRRFLVHGPVSGSGGYVGWDNPHVARNLVGILGATGNVPVLGPLPPWPSALNVVLAAALALLLASFWLYDRSGPATALPGTSRRRIVAIGALLGVLPAFLTTISVKHWFPYYGCMPAIGLSMLFALLMIEWRPMATLAAISVFLIMGIWSRASDRGKATVPTEENFRRASECCLRIEADVHRLRPSFPESARVYMAILAPQEAGIHLHLIHYHALSTWYWDPTLVTRPAEYQDQTGGPTYLFWITPRCEVFEITLPGLRVRSPGARPVYSDYQRTLRSQALGRWAAGDPQGGVSLLLRMQEADSASWGFDHRLAAALLYAAGRPSEAEILMRDAPALSREDAVAAGAAALTPELPRSGLDVGVFRAFEFDESDPELYRALMFYFSDRVLLKKARHMAERLLAIRPGDEDARAMIEAIAKVPDWQQVFVPAQSDSLYQRAY